MKNQTFKKLFHCTYSLQYHLVLVTKYRRKCLTAAILKEIEQILKKQLDLKGGTLLEFNGEADHVHALLELPPKCSISLAVNSIKTVSARLLRRDFPDHLQTFYRKPVLWSRTYFVTSCGGAPLEVIKQYIQQQETPH